MLESLAHERLQLGCSLRAYRQTRARSKRVAGIFLPGACGELQCFVRDLPVAVDGPGFRLKNASAHVWSFRWPRDADPRLFQSRTSAGLQLQASSERHDFAGLRKEQSRTLIRLNNAQINLRKNIVFSRSGFIAAILPAILSLLVRVLAVA